MFPHESVEYSCGILEYCCFTIRSSRKITDLWKCSSSHSQGTLTSQKCCGNHRGLSGRHGKSSSSQNINAHCTQFPTIRNRTLEPPEMYRSGYLCVVSDDFTQSYFWIFEYYTYIDMLTASSLLGLEGILIATHISICLLPEIKIFAKMELNHQTIGHSTNRNENTNDFRSHKFQFWLPTHDLFSAFLEFTPLLQWSIGKLGPSWLVLVSWEFNQQWRSKRNGDSRNIKRPL